MVKVERYSFGFTLIELLVVIAIIGLLASTVLASLDTVRAKARDAKRISDLNQIRLALELYFADNGYYPASGCGWDCNGYRYSYSVASWAALASDLAPYIDPLPIDPVNNACAPWGSSNTCLSYAYGNVGRVTQEPQYDLTTHLETPNHPLRCSVNNWKFYFNDQPWCGSYSGQVYEASN